MAKLLGWVSDIYAVEAQIIAPCCFYPKDASLCVCELVLRCGAQRLFLDAWNKRWFPLLVGNQDLLATRIDLEKYAGLTSAKATVEDSQL